MTTPPEPARRPEWLAAYLDRQERCPVCGEWTTVEPLTDRCVGLHSRAARGRRGGQRRRR